MFSETNHLLCRSAGIGVSSYLLGALGDPHPEPGPVECDSAIEELRHISINQMGQAPYHDVQGLGYFEGSYTAFGSCSC